MSVGVVTVAVGDAYQSRLPSWVQAVADLDRPPDAVTIAVDDIPTDLADEVLAILPTAQIIHSTREWRHHPQVLANDAVQHTGTDWICKMDADDVILPHALTPLDGLDADVLMFGIELDGTAHLRGDISREEILSRRANVVFSGSPYRRHLWEQNHYRDMIFEDWAFWIGCAEQGARFVTSNTVDYVYTRHDGQMSARSDTAYWTSVVRGMT